MRFTISILIFAFATSAAADYFVAWGVSVWLPDGEERPPGNSLPQMKTARERGFAAVELDLRMSRDGVPVLGRDKWLNNYSASDIKTMPIGEFAGETVYRPTLEEALRYVHRPRIVVGDMRVGAEHAETISLIVDRSMDPADFVFTLYKHKDIAVYRKHSPESKIFLKTYYRPTSEWVDQAVEAGADGVMFRPETIEDMNESVALARARELETMTFHNPKRPMWEAQRQQRVDYILSMRLYLGSTCP